MRKETKKGVFIIESLDFDDEENERYEGQILSRILKISDIQCKYFYIRTEKELNHVLNIFQERNFRYLHKSCHGNNSRLATTLDEIDFDTLSVSLCPFLDYRRLFLSACSATNKNLAKQILTQSNCYSIIGPKEDIEFDDAALF